MKALFVIFSIVLFITFVLYGQQPDPPSLTVELLEPAWDNKKPNCEIKNYDLLKKSAIVYTWVNGTEYCYNKRRERAGLEPGGSSRDKEMGELKYSLRSLLKFAPWLEGPIYIVTPGQIPDWLDTSNPRITVIDQDDLLPRHKTKLPTFDTNVIEQYLYKIPGLTDIFIHMNDDYLFVKPIKPHRLFTCDGGLQFLSEINHIRHVTGNKNNAWLSSVRNTVKLMDETYGGEHVINFLKHAPFVYSRVAFEAIHEKFKEELDEMLSHQQRHSDDLNIPLMHHIYMIEEGSRKLSIPVRFNPLSEVDDWLLVRIRDNDIANLEKIFSSVLEKTAPQVLLALNDEYKEQSTADVVRKFYAALLPTPEFFELPMDKYPNEIVSNYHGPDCAYDASILPLPQPPSSILRGLHNGKNMLQDAKFNTNTFDAALPSPYDQYLRRIPISTNSNVLLSIVSFFGFILAIVSAVIILRISNSDIFRHSRAKNT